MEILIATKNRGKVRELKELLNHLPVRLRDLNEFPNVSEIEETGKTFAENAELKARGYAAQTGLRTIADDSGLEVEALGGKPGVYSARYAGESATDAEKIEKLLSELKNFSASERNARFVCAITIADENGETRFSAEGVCDGKIAFKPRGDNGFGYDPVFVPQGFEQTFGELARDIKQEISHRARAMKKIIQYLSHKYDDLT